MQTNIREVTEQFEKAEIDLTLEGVEDMRNDCLDMLKAILWVLDGAKYLWQGKHQWRRKKPRQRQLDVQFRISFRGHFYFREHGERKP